MLLKVNKNNTKKVKFIVFSAAMLYNYYEKRSRSKK